jgi:putative holliday junction resolvase
MAKILAFDYGKKRTGIAETDNFQIIASGLTTVNTSEIYIFLEQYLLNNTVEKFIVGMPKQMNGEDSESVPMIKDFIQKLQEKHKNIPVETIDERFTSKMAVQTMINSGLKKKQRQNKALVDEIAATIILQDYLNYR